MRRNGKASRLASTWIGLACLLPLANAHAAPGAQEGGDPTAATLEIRAIDSARIQLDGTTHDTRDDGSVELRVSAGDHRVQVTAEGYHPWRVTVRLRPGSHVTMLTDLLATDASAHPPRLASALQVQKPDVLLEPPRLAAATQSPPPKQPGVFLSPPQAPTLMHAPPPATSTALMPTRSADTQALMPTNSASSQATAEVFLATPSRRTFLPTRRSSPSELFMTERRPSSPSVFMSTD